MSSLFTAKAAPADDKLRGGYYTPEPIARFVADWVARAGGRLLEPSCGDGSILRFLAERGHATGVELFRGEAAKAAEAAPGAEVVAGDFFRWFGRKRHGAFDGVAGNPPYIRFGSWDDRYREPAFELMRGQGLKPTRLTNAWLPFVVASLMAVRDGGRVGLVIPAELLQVSYAAALRAHLVDSCSEITVVSFSQLVFPGILQEVVLLLAEKGAGPARMRTAEVANAEALSELVLTGAATRAPLHETEKWSKYFLQADEIEELRTLRGDPRLRGLSAYAAVNVGVVTGRNSFFCLDDEQAARRGLAGHTINLLSRSAQLKSVRFTEADLAASAVQGLKTRLLAVPADLDLSEHPALASYVELGEREEVHLGYKCSIRPSWWSVPSVSVPSGFMLRQVSTILRLSANEAGATSTDTVHRVFAKPGVRMPQLAVAALNSATLAFAEILGRSYGGGLLELEPSECGHLPVPDPALVPDALIDEVDALMRADDIHAAIALVDRELLVERAGFEPAQVARLGAAAARLRERRLGRGRGPSKR